MEDILPEQAYQKKSLKGEKGQLLYF